MRVDYDRIFIGNIYKKTGDYSNKLIKEKAILISLDEYLIPLSKIQCASDLAKLEWEIPIHRGEPRVPDYFLSDQPTCYTDFYVESLQKMFSQKGQIRFYELKLYEYVPVKGCECF